jgi:PAS domain S-box-containing protein
VNSRWLEYTGAAESELSGYGWLDSVHPDDRNRVRQEWRAAVRGGIAFDSEFRLRSAAGAFRWFKARSVPIRDSQDAILRWYGTNADVDDLKPTEGGRRRSGGKLP